MIRVAVALFFAMLACAPSVAAQPNIQTLTSPGGVPFWLVQEDAVPLVALSASFEGGAALDAKGREGAAWLAAALLTEGAGDLDALAFKTALEDKAIRIGFSAGRDSFGAGLQTLSENADEAFRLFALALAAPRFDDDAVARVRKQALVSLQQEKEDPNAIAYRTWYAASLAGHPFARAVNGTPESVEAIEVDDMRDMLASQLTRDRLKISIVGDIDPARAGALIDAAFAALPAESAAPRPAPVPAPAPGVTLVTMDVPQSVAVWGGPGLPLRDPDFFAAFVMDYVLGGGSFASRLMNEVREKRGLAYGVSTFMVRFRDSGLYMGEVGTENARIGQSLDLIRAEIARMRAGGVTDEELKNAKAYLTGSFALRLDSNSKIASFLTSVQVAGFGPEYMVDRNRLIDAVTRADVQRAAGRLLDPDKLSIVVIGKPEGIAPTR